MNNTLFLHQPATSNGFLLRRAAAIRLSWVDANPRIRLATVELHSVWARPSSDVLYVNFDASVTTSSTTRFDFIDQDDRGDIRAMRTSTDIPVFSPVLVDATCFCPALSF